MRNYSGRNPFTLDHIGLFSLNFSFLTLHCSVVLRFCPGNLVFACQLEGAIGEFCYHWGYLKNISQKENWETQGKGNLKTTFPSHQPKFLNRANTVFANGNGSAIWRKKWCFLETILTKQKKNKGNHISWSRYICQNRITVRTQQCCRVGHGFEGKNFSFEQFQLPSLHVPFGLIFCLLNCFATDSALNAGKCETDKTQEANTRKTRNRD